VLLKGCDLECPRGLQKKPALAPRGDGNNLYLRYHLYYIFSQIICFTYSLNAREKGNEWRR